jgi:hypothetical protein
LLKHATVAGDERQEGLPDTCFITSGYDRDILVLLSDRSRNGIEGVAECAAPGGNYSNASDPSRCEDEVVSRNHINVIASEAKQSIFLTFFA